MTKLESTVTTIPLRSTTECSCLSSGWVFSGRAMLALPALLATSIAFDAQSDPGDYERLLNEANSKGVASVLVTLDDTVTLEEMGNSLDSIKAEMESKAGVLLAELGEYALTEGYWSNGIGQIGLYVNAKGLQVLANSASAVSFSLDDTRTYRIRAMTTTAASTPSNLSSIKKALPTSKCF